MTKLSVDVCDICDEILTEAKSGIVIEGEDIAMRWAGRNSPKEDLFQNNGQYAPMNGRISFSVCRKCLDLKLKGGE